MPSGQLMSRKVWAVFWAGVALAVVLSFSACVAAPVEPPPYYPPPPIEPPPVDPDPDPIEVPTGDFDSVTVGMTQAEVVALVGQPSQDPPENSDELVDVVVYDRDQGSWMVVYKDGLVQKVVWTPTGVVR